MCLGVCLWHVYRYSDDRGAIIWGECCCLDIVCEVYGCSVMGLTIDAPSVEMHVFYASVYMTSLGFHTAWKFRMGYRLLLGVVGVFLGSGLYMIGCYRFVAFLS